MIYCHKNEDLESPCTWQHELFVCPKHGYERNENGTNKSTLSLEEKRQIRLIREKARKNESTNISTK